MHQRESATAETEYLERFAELLGDVAPRERDDIVREVQSHIAEARQRDDDIAGVLARLGSPEVLAGQYRVTGRGDDARHPVGPLVAAREVLFALAGVAAITTLGVALTLVGTIAVALAVGSLAFPQMVASAMPSFIPAGSNPGRVAAIAIGVAAIVVGVVALRLVPRYARRAGRATRTPSGLVV